MKKLFPGNLRTSQTRLAPAFTLLITFLVPACAVLDTHQAKLDQQQLRDVLMDYTEDQILDNLIRAYNGRPIVHFDLSNVTSQVTSKITPAVGGGRVVTDVRARTPTHSTVTTNQTTTAAAGQTVVNTVAKTVSAVGGVVETVAKPFNWGVSAERDNAIGLQVDPVLDQPTVYAAYIKFLNTDVPKPPKIAVRAATAKLNVDAAQPNITIAEENTKAESEPVESPPETPTPGPAGTETSEFAENAAKPKPSPKKPDSKEAPVKVDLILRDFASIRSLRRTSSPPAAEEALTGKKWKDEMYYWVPVKYRKEFFDLCVATVVRGGSSTSAEAESQVVKQLKQSNALERQRLLKGQ